MAFTYKNIRYCFRWIKPGRFNMGSPETEPERGNNEVSHEVILTEGFWLGETVCTQELWETVMGNNPSSFKGEKLPVENVSWNDCNKFLEKINSLMPGLELYLPTEAQWEYACRSGTQTPFSFGDNINTAQVNYDGNYPYQGGIEGKYREKTVEVKSLPCNDWGLYEMHGNVYEWCNDWYGDYDLDASIDPVGPNTGTARVLRGGSWYYDAGNVRSAFRDCRGPAYRYDFVGFRLARGHK